jgi:tellurite resistance protein
VAYDLWRSTQSFVRGADGDDGVHGVDPGDVIAALPRAAVLARLLVITFPAASVAALAITWLHLLQPFAWQAITVGVLAAVAILVVSIATKSILLLSATTRAARRQRSTAEKQATG